MNNLKSILDNPFNLVLTLITLLIYIWSAIYPFDYFVWFLETAPAFIGCGLIIWTHKKFPLSNLLFRIILIHMIILAIGGHYSYAEVPLFNYFKEVFDLNRNEYDKVGHFIQGVTPALLTQEIIWHKTNLKNKILIAIFSISTALAFSAIYEILEWLVSILAASTGENFTGAQGDIWDAQKDMLTAFLGAVFAVFIIRNKRSGQLR